MPRPVTLFTGQWADLPLELLAPLAQKMGYHGLELACWGDHFDPEAAASSRKYLRDKWDLLQAHGLTCHAGFESPGVGAPDDRRDWRAGGPSAEAVVLCTSALQPIAERVLSRQGGQLMADAMVPTVSLTSRNRVGVVGAVDEEEERFWRRRFNAFGRSEALFPVAADRARLARLAAEEFSHGVINETARTDILRILYGLREAGARAFVFLSPELGSVMAQADSVLAIFDATELHALAAVDWAFGTGSDAALLDATPNRKTDRSNPALTHV